MTTTPLNRDGFAALDATDPLRAVRERFVLPEGVIYLDGNSLGPLPRATAARMAEVVETQWGSGLIRGWNESGWIGAPERLGDKIAPIIGAREGEVLVCDTATIALIKLLGAAMTVQTGRRVILTEPDNFPTDLYAAEAIARLYGDGVEVRRVPRAQLAEAIDATVAVVYLTHVDFRSGNVLDLPGLTTAAHRAGALTLWDLCHSAGAVVVDCEANRVDLAVGCGYKYLNGGPGAPAFLYVRRALQDQLDNPLPGWLGHAAPFDFAPDYLPAPGIRRFLTSSPSILGMAALESALDVWADVDVVIVADKAMRLTSLFADLVEDALPGVFTPASPPEAARRGAQLSVAHGDGYAIVSALIARGVIGDFRPPDICRFGFAPLNTRYVDVFDAVQQLVAVMEAGEYRDARFAQRALVT